VTQPRRRSIFKVLVAERLEQRFVFDGSVSPVDWGMGNHLENPRPEIALVAQHESFIPLQTAQIWANDDEGIATEFRLEIDGFPVAQELRNNKLFLVLNLPDGTGRVDEFDVSDVLSPERISSVKIPNIVNAANFFENVLVLQTMDPSGFPEMGHEQIFMEGMDTIDLSPLSEEETFGLDASPWVFPLPTVQVFDLDDVRRGVVASHSFSYPIEQVFVLGNDLFAVTSSALDPVSIDTVDRMSGSDLDEDPQSPFVLQSPKTDVERFHLNVPSGTLTHEETFALDGVIMKTDTCQSDTTEGIALLVQSFTEIPYELSSRVSIQAFTLTANEIAYDRIPVTLPWGDSWVSSFEFEDGRGMLGSPQGLTMIDATGTGPLVLTSLIYEDQFSTWARLDDQLVLRIANANYSEDGSIDGQSVALEVLDVSDPSQPKAIIYRTFDDSDKPDTDWTWSILENHILKQSEGHYLLVIPTSSMPTGLSVADPDEVGDWLPMQTISLPWILESNVQLISIALSPASIDVVGEFKFVGPIAETHLNEDTLTAIGYSESVVVNLSKDPLSPIRIALQKPVWRNGDPDVLDDLVPSSIPMAGTPANPTDANKDGQTNQLDVLLLINELNLRGSYALSSSSELSRSMLQDVNGDQWLTPLDVLVVINWINRTTDTGFDIESESASIASDLLSIESPTESTMLTREQTNLLDDSFATLSLDWHLQDDLLSSVNVASRAKRSRS
jgi:hypothetical protein